MFVKHNTTFVVTVTTLLFTCRRAERRLPIPLLSVACRQRRRACRSFATAFPFRVALRTLVSAGVHFRNVHSKRSSFVDKRRHLEFLKASCGDHLCVNRDYQCL